MAPRSHFRQPCISLRNPWGVAAQLPEVLLVAARLLAMERQRLTPLINAVPAQQSGAGQERVTGFADRQLQDIFMTTALTVRHVSSPFCIDSVSEAFIPTCGTSSHASTSCSASIPHRLDQLRSKLAAEHPLGLHRISA